MNGLNKYICCFCNRTIKDQEVSSLIVISKFKRPQSEQNEQQLFCHLSCLQTKMHQSIPFYLMALEEE